MSLVKHKEFPWAIEKSTIGIQKQLLKLGEIRYQNICRLLIPLSPILSLIR